jgi:hypothetical protein
MGKVVIKQDAAAPAEELERGQDADSSSITEQGGNTQVLIAVAPPGSACRPSTHQLLYRQVHLNGEQPLLTSWPAALVQALQTPAV